MTKKTRKAMVFIYTKILKPYIFCYILFFATFTPTLYCSINEPWKGWLVSFSTSMLSLPVIFIIYTLYNDKLHSKTRETISQKVSLQINDVFAKYIYFTHYFYNKIEDEIELSEDILNNQIKSDEQLLFSKVSSNIFSGIFAFSDFDPYDEYIFDIINEPIIAKYLESDEIALLFNFINAFISLKDNFRIISKDNFIYFDRYENIHIEESNYFKNSRGKIFYDSMWLHEDNTTETFYSATYPLFEKDVLIQNYKLSGNTAKSISEDIYKTYSCINNWLKYKNIEAITCPNASVFCGRLSLENNMTINFHMKQNFSFQNRF